MSTKGTPGKSQQRNLLSFFKAVDKPAAPPKLGTSTSKEDAEDACNDLMAGRSEELLTPRSSTTDEEQRLPPTPVTPMSHLPTAAKAMLAMSPQSTNNKAQPMDTSSDDARGIITPAATRPASSATSPSAAAAAPAGGDGAAPSSASRGAKRRAAIDSDSEDEAHASRPITVSRTTDSARDSAPATTEERRARSTRGSRPSRSDNRDSPAKQAKKRRVVASDDEDSSFSAQSGSDAESDDYSSDEDASNESDNDMDEDDMLEEDDERPRSKASKASKAPNRTASSALVAPSTPRASNTTASAATSPRTPVSAHLARFAASSPNSTSPRSTASPMTAVTPSSSAKKGMMGLGSALASSPAGASRDEEGQQQRYPWLVNVKDGSGRLPTDPAYDPRTLFIPPSAWAKFTPFEKQYWTIKKDHWDTVVFFKKGKFYEFYEKDALIAHREFDLKMSDRVNMFMAGVPESSFTMWASKFIALGYKVAKVDETESALSKAMREKNEKSQPGPKEKIIRRELTSILTRGTLMGDMLVDELSTYILSIKEDTASHSYGLCFADTGTAEFNLCGFQDDPALTTLETLLMQVRPKEIVCERNNLSAATMRLIKNTMSAPTINPLTPRVEFWEAAATIDELVFENYFSSTPAATGAKQQSSRVPTDSSATSQRADTACFPQAILDMQSHPLVISALGGLVHYLRTLCIERELLSQRNFHLYDALRHGSCLLLDGQTLQNLDVLFASSNTLGGGGGASGGSAHDAGSQDSSAGSSSSSSKGGKKQANSGASLTGVSSDGSLHALLNRCVSPFGKRLFRRWLCHPLRHIPEINDRYDAVEDLLRLSNLTGNLTTTLRKLPDLERIVSRIHAGSCKLEDFLRAIDGFKQLQSLMQRMPPQLQDSSRVGSHGSTDEITSRRLRRCLTVGEGCFPDLSGLLTELDAAFDQRLAKEQGSLIPFAGVDEDYDKACEDVRVLETKLQDHLVEVQRLLKDRTIAYRDIGNEKYQLEVPVRITDVPGDWDFKSSTKAVRRFWTPLIRKTVTPLAEAIETRQAVLREGLARALARFDTHVAKWSAAVRCVAELDCLLSLASASSSLGDPVCRPTLVERGDDDSEPVLELEDLRHPLLAYLGSSYIANDTALGGKAHPRILLLTGPNMGGKSTLLRQTCLSVIMAQLGCFVPAAKCVLSPVDRIFTRIGANDNILAGQSTFMVELRETSNILKNATRDSLVILDELGRGTSTFDGYSIAYSVLHHLSHEIRCRALFSTHYHMLTDEVIDEQQREMQQTGSSVPIVGLAHMACLVDEGKREVTFLYKLTDGVCNKSHGMNVANMAGLPSEVIDRAEQKAAEFEAATRALHSLNKQRLQQSPTPMAMVE
ncbi:mismatch repair protein Msh6 [Capsaspora owczarzaki ATCC 30864]|uniref:DNA mismatch repair protein n=1 Tax=Capsaspora owczarzaki (strain ATCC 30864) TaxID=595528 RepID=A0A0D2WHX5_CAPO3|nr:mismatch repair protein Msh6 [Capsaspora owczarzaki ATCC 30864]KJE89320.1 mismatch repair protein Msh6 [Capsaspora owczarzaki ATCC 30864]|eukprot:XP_004365686.2 mismatch repair protein Msh6 [Capsaspora owczarzaki ATCC 30864]